MKQNRLKKLIAGVTAFAITAATLFTGTPVTAEAETLWKQIYTSSSAVTLPAHETYKFTVDNPSYGYLKLTTQMPIDSRCGITVKIANSEGREMGDHYFSIFPDDDDWTLDTTSDVATYSYIFGVPVEVGPGVTMNQRCDFPAGKLTFRIYSAKDTMARFTITAYARGDYYSPHFSQDTYTVARGYKHTLTLENDSALSFKSSNKKVATINSKGVVTAKKKGTTTITASTESGSILKCKVKVVTDNVYKGTKLKAKDVPANFAQMQVYSAKFDSKGNLVLKLVGVNNNKHKVTLRYAGVTALGSKTTIANASSLEKSFVIPKKSVKTFTLTIPKSAIIKKAELTNGVELNYYEL